jgi:hypothetical protein
MYTMHSNQCILIQSIKSHCMNMNMINLPTIASYICSQGLFAVFATTCALCSYTHSIADSYNKMQLRVSALTHKSFKLLQSSSLIIARLVSPATSMLPSELRLMLSFAAVLLLLLLLLLVLLLLLLLPPPPSLLWSSRSRSCS